MNRLTRKSGLLKYPLTCRITNWVGEMRTELNGGGGGEGGVPGKANSAVT